MTWIPDPKALPKPISRSTRIVFGIITALCALLFFVFALLLGFIMFVSGSLDLAEIFPWLLMGMSLLLTAFFGGISYRLFSGYTDRKKKLFGNLTIAIAGGFCVVLSIWITMDHIYNWVKGNDVGSLRLLDGTFLGLVIGICLILFARRRKQKASE